MTLQQSQMSLFEESDVWTLSVEDFRARLSALQETDEVLKIHEELCSLKLLGSHLFSDLNIYSLRMSKDCSTTIEEIRSRPSSEPWTNWGMMWNGKCLTAKILESPKIGSVCLLSDILEEEVPEQYFLSAEMTKRLIANNQKSKKVGNIRKKGKSQSGDVVSIDSLAPTLCSTTTQKDTLKVAIPVLTPNRIDKRQNGRRFKEDGEPMFTLTGQDRHGIVVAGKLPGNHDQNSRVYNPRGLAPTLSTMQGGGQEPKIIQKARGFNKGAQHSIAPTLSSNSWQENNLVKVVDFYNKITKDEVGTLTSSGGGSTVRAGSFGITDGYRIRKLTPRECWRLQGFPDWSFDKAQEVNSNSQLYKQAGNSVTVNVIAAIAKELK